jgi:hypothetical protein
MWHTLSGRDIIQGLGNLTGIHLLEIFRHGVDNISIDTKETG